MSAIKPGTRCGCREDSCVHHAEHHPSDVEAGAVPPQCDSHCAVRMVTVRGPKVDRLPDGRAFSMDYTESHQVPMCEPCATYHESKEMAS